MLRLFAAALIIVGTIAAALRPLPESLDAWPMFRGTHTLTGVTETTLPHTLKLHWSYEAKESIESSASIVNGTVYVGSVDGFLHAIDLATGKSKWQYKTTGPVQESSPCVHEGVVYIGDLDGTLHAVDAESGKVRWTFRAQGEVRSSPNISGSRLYFGSYDQNLYCLSVAKGALLWKYETEGPVHCTPAIDKGIVYISGCDEHFRAIDAATGKQLYAIQVGAYVGASAAIQGQRAFFGTFGNEVVGIDLEKRSAIWIYQHPTRTFPFYSSAAAKDGLIVLGGRDKLVHCLEQATGKEVWSFMTKARVESSPLVTGERVFIGSNDGVLYEFNLRTGKKVWDFTAGAPLSASPAAAQGSLVIGSQDGVLYCFGN